MATQAPRGVFRARPGPAKEVDLDALTGELLDVAEQTMQPTQASLWLRPRRARV